MSRGYHSVIHAWERPQVFVPEAPKAFEVQGAPATILVDDKGVALHYWVGIEDLSSMGSVLRAVLGQSPSTSATRHQT